MMSAPLPLPAASGSSSSPGSTREWRSAALSRRVLAAKLAAAVLYATALAVFHDALQSEREAASRRLETLVFALAQHVRGTFEQADAQVRTVREMYVRDIGLLSRAMDARNRAVDRTIYPLEGVIGPDGRMAIASTNPFDLEGARQLDLSDRPHFRHHLTRTDDDLYIGTPLKGRASKREVIQLTRAIRGPDQSLLGVVVASVSPSAFVAPYVHLVGDTGVIAIAGTMDKRLRVRVSHDSIERPDAYSGGEDVSGAKFWEQRAAGADSGVYEAASQVDGVPRLYRWLKIPDYPLVVIAGYGSEELGLAPYGLSRGSWYAGLFLLAMLLGGLVLLVCWSEILRARAVRLSVAMEAKVEQEQAESEQKSRFIAGVAHELRTPLHGITGHAELLTLEAPEGPLTESAHSVLENACHMRAILDQLLDLARFQSGVDALDPKPVDLPGLIKELAHAHEASAGLKGLALRQVLGPDLPPTVIADPTALRRVLHNLLSNAIKFTDRGGVLLSVERADGDRVRFSITDTGVGIEKTSMDAIFAEYTPMLTDRSGSPRGTGLGLSLSRKLVAAMGGDLRLASTPGAGATFYFDIPVVGQPGRAGSAGNGEAAA